MFCPNCGTQNDSAATPCKKCGFKLSGISLPKFKGTMMLNSDQTVQELIEEHRRKQAEGGAADKAPKKGAGSSAPPSSLSSPRGPVFQPPRAAGAARGRMGGTMMGVAPQAGGVTPSPAQQVRPGEAPVALAPSPVPVAAPGSEAASEAPPAAAPATAEYQVPDQSPADGLAGMRPVPIAEPAPPAAWAEAASLEAASLEAASLEAARREAARREAASLEAGPSAEIQPAAFASDSPAEPSGADDSPRGRARTRPLATVSALDEAPTADAEAIGGEPSDPDSRAAETQPPRHRVAATLALPQSAETTSREDGSNSPARIRPLDVVLIVCTFGLYGIVLWFRQRARPA